MHYFLVKPIIPPPKNENDCKDEFSHINSTYMDTDDSMVWLHARK
jgi:hypothetical protein